MIRWMVLLGSWLANPLRLPACRYEPSCSEYACGAFETHSAPRAIGLVMGRIFRCAPWGGGGYDPVPPAAQTRQPQIFILKPRTK